ncbi:MAG: hypothetical protein RI894_1172 [Bacteroidota bacterium]
MNHKSSIAVAALLESMNRMEQKRARLFLEWHCQPNSLRQELGENPLELLTVFDEWLHVIRHNKAVFLEQEKEKEQEQEKDIAHWLAFYKPENPDKTQDKLRDLYDLRNNKLKAVLEDFLLLEAAKHKPFLREMAILNIYEQRGITDYKHFAARIKRQQDNLPKHGTHIEGDAAYKKRSPQKNATHPKISLKDDEKKWQLESTIERFNAQQQKRIPDNDVVSASEKLDLLFMTHKIRYLCDALTRNNLKSTDLHIHLAGETELIAWIEAHQAVKEKGTLLNIYFDVYKMIKIKDRETAKPYYESLVDSLKKYGQQIADFERNEFCTYALNYLARGVNNNEDGARKLFFDLNTDLVTLKLHKMTPTNLSNIVKCGLRVAPINAVERFLEIVKTDLQNATHMPIIQYCQALIYYEEKKYQEVLDTLPEEKAIADVYYPLNLRALKLKTYFFTDETNLDDDSSTQNTPPFKLLLKAFRKFLKERTKTNLFDELRVRKHTESIDFIDKLYDIKHGNNRTFNNLSATEQKNYLAEVYSLIEDNPDVIDKEWYASAMEEMK